MLYNHLGFHHMLRINELNKKVKARVEVNFKAVIFLIAGNRELEEKIIQYIDFCKGEYKYQELLDSNIATELDLLVKLSIALYNEDTSFDVSNLSNLSQRNLSLALRAISFRYRKFHTYTSEWGIETF